MTAATELERPGQETGGRRCPSCGREVRAGGMQSCARHVADDLGITYRQLDYWVSQGYLRPEPRRGGTGVSRAWPAGETEIARRMAQLTSAGIAVERAAVFARESWPAGEIAPGIMLSVTRAAVGGGDPIEELWSGPGWQDISARTVNALRRDGYGAVRNLTAATTDNLRDVRNFGAGCFAEVRRVLAWHGLCLAGEEGVPRG